MRTRTSSVLPAALLAAMAGGCNLLIGIQKDYVVGSHDGGGGAGGDEASAHASGNTDTAATTTSASASSGATADTNSAAGTSSSASAGAGGGCVDVGSFCVDATEVTNAAYADWLATSPSTATQPSFCAWNSTFTPTAGWPAASPDEPVVNVDWCDAYAFCAAAGKRLCGKIGGGPVPFDNAFADPAQSQWMAACTNGGTSKFPYGAAYGGAVCDGKDYAKPVHAIAVGSAASCHGTKPPYDAIFDMSGNVAEWEDSCSGESGASDTCRRRGGTYKGSGDTLRCDADDATLTRSAANAFTGFRCCGS